ncbi:biopolymer transporter ExbD [Marinomonas sp. 15G1-11]|uniref:Biopolymer transporter ExbD n=1 Tax=Marinomonas phaeophyticola TaxID=3004091 RepID=A0ABT4JZC4_9GAMM|nr:biopolymer transporter ExbD [Marinomonas sp. 15G1-11]MCZ2723740.1 biopolymer transporter ExbD [Marinomonas sp. 15G1-11]
MLLEMPKKHKHSISITPLIDVVFILLLFFMLSSTFNPAKQIELNTAPQGKAIKSSGITQKILLQAEDKVNINGITYLWGSSEMQSQLQTFSTNGDKVVLAARSDVSVQSVIKLIDQVYASGVKNLNISESVTR